MTVTTTDLSIPNRRVPGEQLEDGLLPLKTSDRDELLRLANANASEELFFFLTLGFFTGMRLGTIADLRIATLANALQEPSVSGLYRLAIGPQATPPVATKFGISGHAWITRVHLDQLLEYAHSTRRLKREAKAPHELANLLFLTRYGNSYAQRGTNKSAALNVEIHSFRKKFVASRLPHLRHFHFHQTRCTFATELAKIALSAGDATSAIALVQEALLHKDEATSLRYIKFLERNAIKEEAANSFTRDFLGLIESIKGEKRV
uniref:hypothetical protein n=1 Tax=Cupriavidus taiwanensis TaxID=164546 RepID=UPI001F11D388|nr:hypothetical protein [Cupriavidus taiwanensis]